MTEADYYKVKEVYDSEARFHTNKHIFPMGDEKFKETLEEENRTNYIVEKSGKLAGYLFLIEDKGLIIEHLAVHQSFLNKGVADLLYRKAEVLAEKKGYSKLKAFTLRDDDPIPEYYLQKGWKRGAPALHLQKYERRQQMTVYIIVAIVIMLAVLALTLIAISKGYAFKHTIDDLPNGDGQEENKGEGRLR